MFIFHQKYFYKWCLLSYFQVSWFPKCEAEFSKNNNHLVQNLPTEKKIVKEEPKQINHDNQLTDSFKWGMNWGNESNTLLTRIQRVVLFFFFGGGGDVIQLYMSLTHIWRTRKNYPTFLFNILGSPVLIFKYTSNTLIMWQSYKNVGFFTFVIIALIEHSMFLFLCSNIQKYLSFLTLGAKFSAEFVSLFEIRNTKFVPTPFNNFSRRNYSLH